MKSGWVFALAACAVLAGPAVPGRKAPAVPAPPTAELLAPLPGGGPVRIRLVFKQGVLVQAAGLPRAFLPGGPPSGDWAGFRELSPEGKRWALGALFPKDTWGKDKVVHRVRWPQLESPWLMASLFMGHGQNYDRLQAANPSNPEKLLAGDLWIIPKVLLSEDLGGETVVQAKAGAPEARLVESVAYNGVGLTKA